MAQIESFATLPLQQIVPAYVYGEFADDPDIQAFFAGLNITAQGYVAWFNSVPLGVYTSPYITGPFLDWVGNGLYGISRPVLSTQTSSTVAGYNTAPYNTIPYNGATYTASGSATLASDDIYKRAMTWDLYRGDGQVFTMGWLKNRVNRFLNGANGSDYPVLNDPPSITVSGNVFTITSFENSVFTSLQELLANNALSVPFQYTFAFVNVGFYNDGGVLWMTAPLTYPTNPTGLAAGAVWYNGGTVSVIPGGSGTGAPVYFGTITSAELLALGGGGLPTTNPNNLNQLWCNSGVICISA